MEEIATVLTHHNYEWIRSKKTSDVYICPVGAIADKNAVTEEELKRLCVDASTSPQND